jgi:hypothetical protein
MHADILVCAAGRRTALIIMRAKIIHHLMNIDLWFLKCLLKTVLAGLQPLS